MRATKDQASGNEARALQLFRDGVLLLEAGDPDALEKFDDASKLNKKLIAALYNAGIAAERAGLLEKAAERYEACLLQEKEQAQCLVNLLLVRAKNGQAEKAEAISDQYLQEFPAHSFPRVAACLLAFHRGDVERAEKFAREAIEREAENIEALYVMARIFYEQKLYAATIWVIKNALEIAPSHGGLYLILGHAHQAMNNLHEALDAYAMAADLEPSEASLEPYGLLLQKRGKVSEALEILKRLVELRPKNFRNHLHVGNAYLANKMFDEAKAAYLLAQSLNPEDKDVNFNLGLLYLDQKPKDISELDRLKTSQSYLRAYLDQPGLSSERVKEVDEYLVLLAQKIDVEEFRTSSESETDDNAAASEQEEETLPPTPTESNEKSETDRPKASPNPDHADDQAPADKPKP